MTRWICVLLLTQFLLQSTSVVHSQTADASDDYQSIVQPFFETHCVKCHGPDNYKGDLNLHLLDSDLASGKSLDRWELILDALESEEMPPAKEVKPDAGQIKAVTRWIRNGLHDNVEKSANIEPGMTTRRLTNFEYQNTMRDLLGIDLKIIEDLPEDPVKPYHFNNTSEFMLLGPEQIDRYLEIARRTLASAIVDPARPETYKTRREWDDTEYKNGFGKMLRRNEIPIHNSGRGTPGHGLSVKKFPQKGEFRIRFQASAVFPNGATELPLRFVMGYNLNVNSSTQEVEPVGVVHLRNEEDDPRIYELRGRIENYPIQKGKTVKGRLRSDTITITPQNIYDDGTLNDENRFLYWPRQQEMPRVVIDWIEFEAPVIDVWPPEHHRRILFDSPFRETKPKKYVREVISRFMTRAYRRPATIEEVNRFVTVYELLKPDLVTMESTMRETLAMVLVTPQFLLHTKSDGAITSLDFELASKLSYFLWGSMPDDELFELALSRKLNDSMEIEKQVRRLLTDPRSRDFVSNFTNQWLSLPKMKTVPINRDLFPRFLYYVEAGERAGTEKPYIPTIRDHMINESVEFVAELIRRNASATNLVDSDFAMLNQPLAAHYGVKGVEGYRIRSVPIMPEHHLGGLLTHGSVLIGNGTGSAPHPIYRAVWLREAILGDKVKPPPAEVPALSDSVGDSAEKALSIKDLLAKHRHVESCNDCHVRLDPWGIPFERYNAIGKYNPKVPKEGLRVRGFLKEKDKDLDGYAMYLDSINTEEVQADTKVPQGPYIDGMQQLKNHLLEDRMSDIGANLIRQLLSYAVGRKLSYRDRFEVERIATQSKSNGFRVRDVIVQICQGSVFRGTEDNKMEQDQ